MIHLYYLPRISVLIHIFRNNKSVRKIAPPPLKTRSQGRDKSNDRLVDIGPREEIEFVESFQTGGELD